jgi:hypothetical protein
MVFPFLFPFLLTGSEITNIIPSKVIEDESSNITNSDKIKSSNIESNVEPNVASESYYLTNDYNYNYNYQWNDASASSYMEYPGYYDEFQLQQSSEQQPDNQIDQIDDEVV